MVKMIQLAQNCSICDLKFEDDISLNIHNFRIHGILIPVFKCKICSEIFPRKTALQEHKLELHKQKQEHSNDTMKSMESKHDSEVSNEKTMKHERKEHKCEICGKLFELKEFCILKILTIGLI